MSVSEYTEIGSDFLNHYSSGTGKQFNQNDLITAWNIYAEITNVKLREIKTYHDLTRNPTHVIVGDVHASFLQLLTPLIKCGFLVGGTVKLNAINKRYLSILDISKLIKYKIISASKRKYLNTKIIYTGDIVGHSIHGMDLLLVKILVDLIKIFPDNIYWCFGNHDMALYNKMIDKKIDIAKVFKVSKYEIDSYPKLFGYNNFKEEFVDFVENTYYKNNVLVFYLDESGKLSCSHKKIKSSYHYIIDVIESKSIKEDELCKIFASDETNKFNIIHYYGHENILKRKMFKRIKINEAIEKFDDLCKELKEGENYCCDLCSSTFSMFIENSMWGYEFISYVALHPNSTEEKIRCPHYIMDYRGILKCIGIE